jgi:hypothetical protein
VAITIVKIPNAHSTVTVIHIVHCLKHRLTSHIGPFDIWFYAHPQVTTVIVLRAFSQFILFSRQETKIGNKYETHLSLGQRSLKAKVIYTCQCNGNQLKVI